MKLIEIDKEIRIENEINNEAEGEVEGFNTKISEIENLIKSATDKVSPLREKNIENYLYWYAGCSHVLCRCHDHTGNISHFCNRRYRTNNAGF